MTVELNFHGVKSLKLSTPDYSLLGDERVPHSSIRIVHSDPEVIQEIHFWGSLLKDLKMETIK